MRIWVRSPNSPMKMTSEGGPHRLEAHGGACRPPPHPRPPLPSRGRRGGRRRRPAKSRAVTASIQRWGRSCEQLTDGHRDDGVDDEGQGGAQPHQYRSVPAPHDQGGDHRLVRELGHEDQGEDGEDDSRLHRFRLGSARAARPTGSAGDGAGAMAGGQPERPGQGGGQLAALPLAEGHVDGQPLEDLLDRLAAGGQRVALDEGGDLDRPAPADRTGPGRRPACGAGCWTGTWPPARPTPR